TARGSGTALLRILNDILDVSKIEAGRFEVEIAPFVLPDCLDEALALLSPKAESQGLTLRCEVADGVPEAIESDEDRLRQILVNLLDNAVKFSPRGEVRLTVERLPVPSALPVETGSAELRFAVHDTGIGIPADRMDRLFKPFSQADSSLSRLYGGTGLGLVISRRLVECLGGRIWVESEPGRGSTFYFTLPCRPAPVLPVRHPTAGDLSDPPLAERLPLRILLAEDNSVNQRVGLLMLERMGYDADVAGNGSEVLAALRRQPYDVILMDLQMPGMDGLEATRRLRAELPPERQPRIVAMTANVLREQREACLAAGMDDFVQKPVSLTDLKEALQRSADGSTRLSAALPAEDILTQPPPDSSLLDPLYLDGLRRLGGRTGRPLVREIVESYLTETPRRVGLLHEAVSRADAGALTFLAHSLKGSSAQLGAVRVAAVSARLEQKGRRSELAELPALLEELEREIARTLPLLEQAVVGAV
ncbi:MAG TPA: ATP-binding protein, partial [Thermoanaerobaculia bacterium]|nr:ATP-binding protein [Thermoanaerobaculia bacterium]